MQKTREKRIAAQTMTKLSNIVKLIAKILLDLIANRLLIEHKQQQQHHVHQKGFKKDTNYS